MTTSIALNSQDNLPKLIKKSSTYKLIIPLEVEQKIRYLQNKFPSTEWSGVLFYTHTGSFASNDLVLTCVDIFPMDLGNSTYTEFSMSEDVTAYIAEHVDTLFECDLGLVHSHHNFQCFFSGTDLATLRSEGNDTNNFLSLIVNNEGTYSAAITLKTKVIRHIQEETSYSFFGSDNSIDNNGNSYDVETTEIHYFMLDIEKPEVQNPYSSLDKRFDTILARKELVKKAEEWQKSNANSITDKDNPWKDYDKGKVKQLSLFKEYEDSKAVGNVVTLPDFNTIKHNPLYLHITVARLLLCSLVINPEKIDMDKWVEKHMEKIYNDTFGNPSCIEFQDYLEWAVQHIMDYYDDPTLSDPGNYEDIASLILHELHSYKPNPYIDKYIKYIFNYF